VDDVHVVVVLIDQLRKDAADRWMPATRTLAADGVVLENMRAAAPWTYPSVVSLFSGLQPQQHGADGDPRGGRRLATFDAGVPLLPRTLRGAGWYTAGFVTNPFFQAWNPLHAAFDFYEIERFIGSQGNLRGFPGAVWTGDMFADEVNAAVVEHFDARPLAEPEFTYVHYIDVHGPWEGAPFDTGGADSRTGDARGYEIATRWIDERVVELYRYFLERYAGRLIFVVTSDHGQELPGDLDAGEGRAWRRRKYTVHDFNLRIPFFVLPSAVVDRACASDVSSSNIDVVPTLLDWLGLDASDVLPGASLLPDLRCEEGGPGERAIYARMSAFNNANECVVVHGRKLMRYLEPGSRSVVRRVVFDLDADPAETRVISDEFGPEGTLLDEATGTHGVRFPARFEAPEEHVLRRLQALGYLREDGGGG
jgi:arylsulfatase A-like enzyme